MANFSASTSPTIYQDPQIWQSLKVAIASSSGFQRWQLEHVLDEQRQDITLDHRVRRYLRETLETLAY
ncbi:hypothetical protein Cri9333_1550 [Crinalium epipsammum PCC 9333]|uniref:Uncharacterized protein n=1 Tax=Crinalium epipsammum PCC 9333 TaxID=1173022 RepID=K9VY45_9CYAN|nr:hypothetical protein [Crinalium epipsammum]AFZ12442.1 hypothetical protein Cri9333_1550 [Crinalium epipsammum PCC 9333]